ncbi:TPA: orotate phosphoribosyltransferase [Candidatus Avigastranaerophilus faecigallinarum]|nr:orotate phosphoribosyltransferase [Candidatus Avigastranaerophilus faecigallinarum]
MTNEVLNLLEQAEGVLHGHFCLTSGLHSDIYFQCAKLYQYPEITSELGKRLAEKLSDIEFDTIVAPAIGAVIIGYETAKNAKKRNLFVERKDGVMQLRRGYTLKKGEKVVIIEDVITTARTIKETMEAIKEYEPEVVAVGCIVDRTKGKTEYNIKSLLQIDPVVYDPNDCPLCREGIELVKPGSRTEVKANA